MNEQLALQNALRSRLENLRIRYPRYSVRAFARKAGISPATLSLILQGKRRVSRKLARQISDRLLFDPQERAEVLRPFLERESRSSSDRSAEYVQLTVDQYNLIGDWRAFALLNLIKTRSFRNDTRWIARRLAIQPQEVRDTIERLKRLGMLTEEGGKLRRTAEKYRTTEDVANLSLRRSHQQTLDLAQVSLERDPIQRRDFTWMTFPLDIRKLSLAKTLIRKFQDDLLAALEPDSEPDEVYRLAIQLFPLTENPDREKE